MIKNYTSKSDVYESLGKIAVSTNTKTSAAVEMVFHGSVKGGHIMREILFRGQHRRYGEQVNMAGEKLPSVWVYGGVLQGEGDFSIIYGSKSPDGKFEEKYPVYTETLGQYTGLTDKNGKKIFEGDIVKNKHIMAKVVYYHVSFCFEWLDERTQHLRRQKIEPMFQNTSIIFEVVGSIHDNPELLKEAT